MSNILVFAGTTEGRKLLELLSNAHYKIDLTVYACVATEYGKDLLPENRGNIKILSGRLTEDEMTLLMKEHGFDYVIDTTHPYAKVASENIQEACARAGCNYIRLYRQSGMTVTGQDQCIFFKDHKEAVEYLNSTSGNVLLTIGSKELEKYTEVQNYKERLYSRVLPMVEVVKNSFDLGFSGKQLICMQGPFSLELNIALLNQIGAQYLVTKDSGEEGGFSEKYQACQITGATLLVIGRSGNEEGSSLEEVVEFLKDTYQISIGVKEQSDLGQWFPLFTNISGKKIVVIGAGKIAQRRIQTLLNFDCSLKVVAKEAQPEVMALVDKLKLDLQLKPYEINDLEGADYVLAATNNSQINNEIYLRCKEKGIPVNVADDKEKSDFYFPGIVRNHGITVGVTAEGKDHGLAKEATRLIGNCLSTKL